MPQKVLKKLKPSVEKRWEEYPITPQFRKTIVYETHAVYFMDMQMFFY